MAAASKQKVKWGYVYFEEKGAAPARDWLESIDAGVRRELLRTVDSVVLFSNPPGYPASSQRWRSMRDLAGVDLGNFCEARDKDEKTLYRLFCRFDSAAQQHGLSVPVLVLLGGASKPVGTEMRRPEYEEVSEAWDRYAQMTRQCSAVSFPPSLPPIP